MVKLTPGKQSIFKFLWLNTRTNSSPLFTAMKQESCENSKLRNKFFLLLNSSSSHGNTFTSTEPKWVKKQVVGIVFFVISSLFNVTRFFKDRFLCLLLRHRSRVDFTNILQVAFMSADPKSAKKDLTAWLHFFAFLESARVKAASKTLMKLAPDHSDQKYFFCFIQGQKLALGVERGDRKVRSYPPPLCLDMCV